MNLELIKKIINIAVSAPSGENCQPWRFEISQNRVYVFNLPERDRSLYNYKQRGSYVANGALIENLVILFSANGYKCDISIFPDIERPDLVADIRLAQIPPKEERLAKYISIRGTNRKSYYNTPLTAQEKNSILEIEKGREYEIKLVEETNAKKRLAEALSANELLLFGNYHLHKFFFSHLRWTEDEEKKNPTGFYIKTLELAPPQLIALKIFKYWLVLKFFNYFGVSKKIAAENAQVYSSAAAFGIITIPNEDDKSFVETGRIFERIWLTATSTGLCIQPVTGVLFFMQRIRDMNAKEFSEKHVELIRGAYGAIEKEFNVKFGIIALLFRIGHSDPSSARSRRIDPEIKILE